MVKKLVHFIYKHCDLILVPSLGYIDNIRNYNVVNEKVLYWPQWGEELIYSNNNKRNSVEKLPEGFCIVFAGNIGAAQGLDIIIDAARLLKKYSDIYWIIIGDGRMKPWLEEQIDRYDLKNNIIMLGQKPLEMMPDYFLQADCLFVSLKHDPVFSLTLPAKVQTYLAAGKPIVAALDGEGARVINESGGGLTSPSNDPHKLADNIIALYSMEKSERIQLGIDGRRFFEDHFRSKVLLDSLIDIFKDLLKCAD